MPRTPLKADFKRDKVNFTLPRWALKKAVQLAYDDQRSLSGFLSSVICADPRVAAADPLKPSKPVTAKPKPPAKRR